MEPFAIPLEIAPLLINNGAVGRKERSRVEVACLISRMRNADIAVLEKRRAFNEIVRRFQDMAFGLAYGVLGDFHLAEDAAQEAFLAAWRNLDSLQNPEAFPGWLKRIVLTQCNRLTRGKHLETVPLDSIFTLADDTPEPFAALARTETKNEMYAAMLTLPPHERIVTTLFYINQHSQNDICAFLELPLTTVKKRLHSARKKLKETLLAMIQETLQTHRPSRDGQFVGTIALYNAALESFVNKVKQDRNIIAVLLFGSLSYDTVWHKSDIDIILISRQEKQAPQFLSLVENGINIHAMIYPRNKFKQAIEGTLQNSNFHSTFAKSTLLYTTDETIRDYYENIDHLGAHDRDMKLMHWTADLVSILTKAEKWLTVKRDLEYAFLWLMFSVNILAKLETLRHNRLTSRETIQQAQKLNPELFRIVYTDFIHAPKDEEMLRNVLGTFHTYLECHRAELCRPLLDYLAEQGRTVTATEIAEYFSKQMDAEQSAPLLCEWLADEGVIQKLPSPKRLTNKSPLAVVDEAAYYYDPLHSQV